MKNENYFSKQTAVLKRQQYRHEILNHRFCTLLGDCMLKVMPASYADVFNNVCFVSLLRWPRVVNR